MRNVLFFLLFSLFLGGSLPVAVGAQELPNVLPASGSQVIPSYEVKAEITAILEDTTEDGVRQVKFRAEDEYGDTYAVDTSLSMTEGLRFDLKVGDDVLLQIISNLDGTATAYLSDIVRGPTLWWLFAVFAVVTIAVGLRRGFLALVGFAVTLALLFWFVFPRVLAGADPVSTTAIACIAIVAVNLFLSHGVTRNTGIAFASVSVGVLLAWLFSALFVAYARLTGLSTEESVFLYWQVGSVKDPVGLLLAGMILGAVGVLDDVAITQCETVAELKTANPQLNRRELFIRAMRVGRHHIASTVNTLVLAYAGSSLPLFLLFMADDSVTLARFLNTEAIAEEIVRTLAGTTALVLTVPVATLLAALAWNTATKADRNSFVHDEHAA